MSETQKWTCEHCGKTAEAVKYRNGESPFDVHWEAMPPGWMSRREYMCGELERENHVCSPECADGLVLAEQAKKEAAHAEYARRKAAGELSAMEKWNEQMVNDYAEQVRRQLGMK